MTNNNGGFAVGDTVSVSSDFDPHGKWRGRLLTVEKKPVGARGVNYKLRPVGGGGVVSAPGDALVRQSAAPVSGVAGATEVVPFRIPFSKGSIVRGAAGSRLVGTGRNQVGADELFVIMEDKGEDRVRMIRLGGNPADSYWRVSPNNVALVPSSEIAAAVATHFERYKTDQPE